MEAIITAAVALLGGFDIVALIIFFVNRHDNKKNIKGKLETLEKDTIRTQLLLLITMKPEESQEILTVAKHYFGVLHGDWYMTSIFNKWLIENHVAEPEWFDREG